MWWCGRAPPRGDSRGRGPLVGGLRVERGGEGDRLGRRVVAERTLEGVADIYSTHAKDPADRLRAAALALLVVTGFRIGELVPGQSC